MKLANDLKQSFGEELPKDLAGALIGPNERCDREHEPLRTCVEVEPVCRIIDPVRQPVRKLIDHQSRARRLGMLGIAQKPCKDPVDDHFDPLDHQFCSLWGCSLLAAASRLSLTIAPGEFIAITGPSGGGKTTLMKILMGLFEPKSGAIRLGDRPISSYRKGKYRRCIGSVAQGDMLYAGSLAENIAFFDPEIDMARVREVARMAQIDGEIEKKPMGYETLVGDMGSVLSGGQLQRVLLARALYPDPKVLILDEGTANLDAENEAKNHEVLRALSITRVAVAHRPATLLAAQRVVAVTAGTLREMPKEPPVSAAGEKPAMFAPPFGAGPERASVMSIVRPAVAASSNSTEQPGASSAPSPLDHSAEGAEDLQREE